MATLLPYELWENVVQHLFDPLDHWALWQVFPDLEEESYRCSTVQFPYGWIVGRSWVHIPRRHAQYTFHWGETPDFQQKSLPTKLIAGKRRIRDPPSLAPQNITSLLLEETEFEPEGNVWEWLQKAVNLRSVHLQGQVSQPPTLWIPWLKQHMPNLEELALTDTWIFDLSMFPDTTLYDYSVRSQCAQTLSQLGDFSNLRSLNLFGCGINPENGCMASLSHLHNLENLDLSYNWFSGLSGVMEWCSTLTNLKSLSLGAICSSGIPPSDAKQFLDHFSQLCELNLNYALVSLATLRVFASRTWDRLSFRGARLEGGLSISGSPIELRSRYLDLSCIRVEFLVTLRPSIYWRHLRFEYCHRVPEEWLNSWVEEGVHLETLSFHGCFCIQKDIMLRLAPCFSTLRELYMEYTMTPLLPLCPRLTLLSATGSLLTSECLTHLPQLRRLYLGRNGCTKWPTQQLASWIRDAPWHHHVWLDAETRREFLAIAPDCTPCIHLMA